MKKYPKSYKMLKTKDTINAGIITKQYEFTPIEIKVDENITWKDFEIGNLTAEGIDPSSLKPTILHANNETLGNIAQRAEKNLDKYQLITEIENELNTPENE